MKKKINWLGWLINVLYVLLFLLLCYYGVYCQRIEHVQGRNLSFSMATLMFISGFAMLPVWYNWSLGKLLPVHRADVSLMRKEIYIARVHFGNGTRGETPHHFITFVFPNGEMIEFFVKKRIYDQHFEGEQGLLLYKVQGKHTYYVNFIKTNNKL